MIALLISDIVLNVHYGFSFFSPFVLSHYLGFAIIGCLGLLLQSRASWKTLLPGSVAASLIFYVVTNILPHGSRSSGATGSPGAGLTTRPRRPIVHGADICVVALGPVPAHRREVPPQFVRGGDHAIVEDQRTRIVVFAASELDQNHFVKNERPTPRTVKRRYALSTSCDATRSVVSLRTGARRSSASALARYRGPRPLVGTTPPIIVATKRTVRP